MAAPPAPGSIKLDGEEMVGCSAAERAPRHRPGIRRVPSAAFTLIVDALRYHGV